MLKQLPQPDFHTILPLYRTTGDCFPLILAVIEQQQRGQIWVDRLERPSAAVVITRFGFMSLLETMPNNSLDANLQTLLQSPDLTIPAYLLWYAPPLRWQQALEQAIPNRVRKRDRIRFEFRLHQATLQSVLTRVPEGFEVKILDCTLLPRTEAMGVKIDSRFWSSAEDFLTHGFGVAVLKDGEIVSLCYTAGIADQLAEVDIVTKEEYRAHGLASVAAQRFIRECLSRNLTPTWDCFTQNTASVRLAEKLGFVPVRNYSFYSFNVPLVWGENKFAQAS